MEPAGWGYTIDAHRAFGSVYDGRPLIGRDTPIQGGVDYGTFPGPAIVVDPAKYPREFAAFYREVIDRVTYAGVVDRGEVLGAVFDVVRSRMQYSAARSDEMAAGQPQGQKVALNVYMDAGVGTCRHMALVAGTLLEMLKEDGHIRGDVSIDRSEQWNPRQERYSGHQWVRYTNARGEVYVLDPAMGYLGHLDGAKARWNYSRPDERVALTSESIAGSVAHIPRRNAARGLS